MENILGITAEYDPFHSGHAYQLARAREQVHPDAVVCAMSGNFTQRGEPAVLDKWTRAKIAVRQGVDLVFELPFMYACSRAERFAEGAVDLLVSAGVTHISFGCEAQQPEDLLELADGQLSRNRQAEEMTRDFMKAGYSRAKATELTSRQLFGNELTDLMLAPNNILALEYLKRTRWWEESGGVTVHSVPVRRYGSDYRQENRTEGYAGGVALRRMMAAGQDINAYLSYDQEEFSWVDLPAAQQRLYELLRSILLRSTPEELAGIYCVGEGMEHRLKREAVFRDTFDSFLTAMISKRYTAATIRRIMMYILMNIREMPACAPYGRVLAASAAGRKLLRRLQDREEAYASGITGAGSTENCESGRPCLCSNGKRIPPLTVVAGKNRMTGMVESMRQALQMDSLATDMYNLICARSLEDGMDAKQRPYIE